METTSPAPKTGSAKRLGRPKEVTPKPVDYPALTAAQTELIAPLNNKGQPDLRNYMPTRLIPHAEATARGWTYFYDARTCRRAHQAPHFTNNVHLCVDCRREKRGKQPIGGRAGGTDVRREYIKDGSRSTAPASAIPSAVVVRAQEPDRVEKQFLTAYAASKNFDASCQQIGVTVAVMRARMAWSSVFRVAVADLENQLSIVHVPPAPEAFEWTEDKYFRFCEVLVDTGLVETARESVQVRPSEVYRELERNSEFAMRAGKAQLLGNRVLEEKAYKMALEGNDKLLAKILTAKMPGEYGESVKLDVKIEERLTDAQLRSEITRLYAQRRGRTIDVECDSDPAPAGLIASTTAPTLPDGEGDRAAQVAESIADLL